MNDLKNISDNGAPILHGDGLQSVRERIEAEFQKSRQAGPTSLVPKPPGVEIIFSTEPAPLAPKPLRPLADRAEAILKVAVKKFAQAPVRHPLHEMYHVIVGPTAPLDLNKLFQEALECLPEIPKVDERLAVADLWDAER